MSGVKLAGRIKSFDKYAVILESGQRDQLIFKHAISTVVTTRSAPAASAPASSPSKPPPPADRRDQSGALELKWTSPPRTKRTSSWWDAS